MNFAAIEFEEGYKAGLRGDDPRLCPYEKMTKEWNRWQFAHRIGCEYSETDACYILDKSK